MLIECEKGIRDDRYFVTATLKNIFLYRPSDIQFVLDTGACRTQLNWHDATRIGLVSKLFLRDDVKYRGMNGKGFNAYKLDNVEIIFTSDSLSHIIKLEKLSIKRKTTDDNKLPLMSSVLGIDVLQNFDILFRGNKAYLKPH